jgi:hypothetical protein
MAALERLSYGFVADRGGGRALAKPSAWRVAFDKAYAGSFDAR